MSDFNMALLSYLNEREHVNWSYYEFLTLNCDVIISLSSNTEDWNGLDGAWTYRFLKEAEAMLKPKDFETLKVKVDSEHSKHGLKTYWENVIHEQKKLTVKRTHILGSLDLLDEAGKHNVKDLSEGLSNSFPVASKHALESTNLISPQENKKIKNGENEVSVEEGISQEDVLNSVTETSNIFREVEFPGYYDKLKKIWCTREAGSNYYVIDLKNKEVLKEVHNLLDDEELKSLFDRLALEDENKYINEAISKMEKVVYSLDELTTRFNYLSHTLPIPAEQYDGFLYPDIHIIRSISSHLSTIIRMDGIVKNTTERSWTAHILAYMFFIMFSHITSIKYFSCERTISTKMDSQIIDYKADGVVELFERPNQIPLFVLEVSGEPSNPDPDKFEDDRQKLMKEGVFALNKFIIRTGLPTYEVCKTLGVFLAQGFEDKLEIGQIIYIGPGLYLFSPFTDPNLIIPTSPFNLEHASRLIRTLLCLRYNAIKKIKSFRKFEKKCQRYIINPISKYATGFTPDRPQTVTLSEFLPKEETSGKVDRNRKDNVTRGRGRGRGRGKGRGSDSL
ncbi:6440_t:CDS:2 [Ambispora leptoticha]|uniref:6440_t:CDS:1 n=1 Tax=Ambispora leptoticha TaxID=144679 RepID=A0A9N9G468_9GLOM|nr:6440_t:CDS:2 [Ambispora leptoticha]